MDNQELAAIRRCQAGDPDAFAELYDAYVKRIYDFVYYRTGHRETAEDLTSTVFTRAFQNMGTFRLEQGRFSSWLFRIARNAVIDNARTRKPAVSLEAAANAAGRDDVAGEAEVRDQLERVRKFLDRLPPDQRDIVLLRLWDQLSYAEISEVTGKTAGNCKVIFSRALRKIQAEFTAILAFLIFAFSHFSH